MASTRERTPFGERLHAARTHAKLSQPQLARAVGLAQSTIGELEYIGTGSSKTTQIAQACGVRAQWLADGTGAMLDVAGLSPEVKDLASQVETLPPKWRDWVILNLRESLKLANEMVTQSSVSTPDQAASVRNVPASSSRRRVA